MTDLYFLKAIKDKLKGGNTKSIHLNVLPGRFATRLDLADLDHIKPGLASDFLDKILNNAHFEFKLSFDGIDLNTIQPEEQKKLGLLSKRLNSLHIENDDNYKEHGIKTFGFGFPLLVKPSRQDPGKIIKAPLFIWQLELSKATNQVNTWSVLRNKTRNENGRLTDSEIHSVELNEVLLSHLKTDENLAIPQLNDELLENSLITKESLAEECFKMLRALNANNAEEVKGMLEAQFGEPFAAIPDAATIDGQTRQQPWIHFGGVFGLFRTQKESIIADIDKIMDKFDDFDFEDLEVESYNGTPHSAVETDPSQQEILSTLAIEPRKIIQGPPGTGKSQSLTALITNALANNLKCLVVCEKKTALDVIKNNLLREDEQLGALAAVIEDINKDRDAIVNSVRERILNLSQQNGFNHTVYNMARETMENAVETMNGQHKQLDAKIYQGKSWTELVGMFLKYEDTASYNDLNKKLDYKQFKLQADDNELPDIIAKLKVARRLYAEVNRLDHPFEILNDGLFGNENPRGIQLMLEEVAGEMSPELEKAEADFRKQIEAYRSWLDAHYLEYYSVLKEKVANYLEFADENHKRFGKIFYQNDGFTRFRINTLSLLSKKYKALKNNRIELVQQIAGIKEVQETPGYVQHIFLEEVVKAESLQIYADNITDLNTRNESWYRGIGATKQQFVRDLSSQNLHPLYSKKASLQKTESGFDKIAAGISERQILKRAIQPAANHNQRLAEAVRLRGDMAQITGNIGDFRTYFYWRQFYIALLPLHRTVVTAVIEAACTDWEASFTSWYYFWLLSLNEHTDLPKDEAGIQELKDAKEALKIRQIKSIVANWSKNQAESVSRLTHTFGAVRSLYNQRGAAGHKRNSLRKIISQDFGFFTDFFPVLMVSPSTCSSIVPLREGLFDIVIFDEASQLRIEDTFPALLRGKIKVVSGDSQQMPPPSHFFQGGNALLNPTDEDNEDDAVENDPTQPTRNPNLSYELANSESLLDYAETSGFKPSLLKVHYRSQHPHLIDFSNHAFYGKRLIPMPAKQDYKSIRFIEVNGLYEDQMNKDEALQVVDLLLHHIKPGKDGKFPTVGVATFNMYQRNLILEEIAKVRQVNPEYDKKISDLGPTFFVKNLENIQGDERDIMILSTTFGRKASGSFGQNFGPVSNKTKGFKLLNVIITRARQRMYICSSIPPEAIHQYPQLLANDFSGNGIFYAYLAYAKAISIGSMEVAKQVLDDVLATSPYKPHAADISIGSESPFEDEVFIRLVEKIGRERLEQQYRVGGFRIDMVVKSKITGKPLIAIECDGAKYHGSNEAYAWDLFRQTQLEKQGFIFHRIWSTNWWFSATHELGKLLEFIAEADSREQQQIVSSIDENIDTEEIIPIKLRPAARPKVTASSIVTLKNPEGKIVKIRFSKSNIKPSPHPDSNGIITISENSAMAMSLTGKNEGEICQLGMLEYYYEILEVS